MNVLINFQRKRDLEFCLSKHTHTSRKVSVFGVFLVRMREKTDQKNSEYGHFYAAPDYKGLIILITPYAHICAMFNFST